MVLVIVSFCVVFLLIASGALLVFYRDALPQRIAEAINPRPKKRNVIEHHPGDRIFRSAVWWSTSSTCCRRARRRSRLRQQRLIRAGYRNESAVRVFYGCKVLVPLLLCADCLC